MIDILNSHWGILFLILLRCTSILVPILPGTYCLIISGYLFGLANGLIISFISDLLACSICFSISKSFGRKAIYRLMPRKYLNKFEQLSKNYLERNFFLLTGFLMTGWFDFVSYGTGLTKVRSRTFLSALSLSVILSDIPFVAAGDGLRKLQNQDFNIRQIIDGEVPNIQGPFLFVFIVSVLLIFSIGIISAFLNKKYIKK